MALLLHTRGGKRVLVAEGCLLTEGDVNAHYTETFDELVALTSPVCVGDVAEHDERRKRIAEGKPHVIVKTAAPKAK